MGLPKDQKIRQPKEPRGIKSKKQSKYNKNKEPQYCNKGASCVNMLNGDCKFTHPLSDRPCFKGASCSRRDECPYNHDIAAGKSAANSLEFVSIRVETAKKLLELAKYDISIMNNGNKNMFVSVSKNMISDDLDKLL
jgi:hypothetical protein